MWVHFLNSCGLELNLTCLFFKRKIIKSRENYKFNIWPLYSYYHAFEYSDAWLVSMVQNVSIQNDHRHVKLWWYSYFFFFFLKAFWNRHSSWFHSQTLTNKIYEKMHFSMPQHIFIFTGNRLIPITVKACSTIERYLLFRQLLQ